jgi:flagellar hook-basal body complex protein FliE
MSSPIAPIAAVSPLSSITATGASSAPAATSGSGANFAAELGRGLDAVSGAQSTADGLAVQAATGQLTDPAQYTIAATQAALMTQMATTIENKAVTAFNTIMGMQA